MKRLPVRFISNDKHAIASYVCFLAKSIQLEKYPKGNYLVLPQLVGANPSCVHFPQLPYSERFWKAITRQRRYSVGGPYPADAVREVMHFLNGYTMPVPSGSIEQFWSQNERSFMAHLAEVMNVSSFYDRIAAIDMLVTEFGTMGSFSATPSPGGRYSLACTWRIDGTGEDLLRTLLQAFLLMRQGSGPQVDVGGIGWHEREAILSYLLSETKLRTMVRPRPVPAPSDDVIRKSHQYLSSLGFPVKQEIGSTFIGRLTAQERLLWLLLTEHKNSIVSFDDVADVLWPEDGGERFSLYAMAKLVQSIREKLRAFGIRREILLTFRRQGYMVVR